MHGNTSHENREIPGFSRRTRSRAGAGAQREVGRRTPLMYEPGKSDSRVVPKKVPNKARRRVAEGLEGRRLAKRNSPQVSTLRTQGRIREQAALGRVRQAAEQKKGERFTALLHHIYAIDTLRAAFYELERDAAPGVDGETWEHYGKELEANLAELSDQLRRGAYRPLPVRRVYIPKRGDAKQQRPIGVTALEDKNRPESDGGGAQRHLRARVCRLLVWRKARAQRAPGADRPGPSDRKEAGEMGFGRRSPRFLRVA